MEEKTAAEPADKTPYFPDTETILKYGTYEYNLHAQAAQWSNGMYALLGMEKTAAPIAYTSFLQFLSKSICHHSTVETNGNYEEEYTIITQGGEQKRIQLSGRREYDSNNQLRRDTGIIRDLTRERRQENVIDTYIQELKRSNRELEEFAYVASHDLQEPLRKISTFCGRLYARFHDELQTEGGMYLDRIVASTESMRALIENLLEFSRIDRVNEPFEATDLNQILQQVKADLELKIEETGTRITSDELPVIQAFAPQMKQLFNNLFNNSIKFRKSDILPAIHLSCKLLTDEERAHYPLIADGAYYSIKMQDNGIGFEKEYATRIFQIFQRLHGKAEYPGSGIGLAICKKIVERHGGLISADSTPGRGASFELIFPEHATNMMAFS